MSLRSTRREVGDLHHMRLFRYRPYRIAVRLDLVFFAESGVLHGSSRNISSDGMRAVLNGKVKSGESGRLTMHNGAESVQIVAQVACDSDDEVVFVFCFESNWERDLLAEFVAAACPRSAPQANPSHLTD